MTHSIRFKFILFILAILLVLILMMNIYPLTSSRETMFQEKRSSLTSQASAVSSALARLDSLSPDEVARVIGAMDLDNFDRTAVIDPDSRTISKGILIRRISRPRFGARPRFRPL